ncbi:scavenger receptor class B member 1 [Achroia grisella]|uniref:scavenger receptor class B member 1 n=1 Tax=Achroia grisella TaxID=688607 RepID=UPI0027D2D7C6|nr:scavenger receptor class B member 1 [Achroia grisella]
MVVGKVPMQHTQTKGRMSIIKIQNLAVYKRQSIYRILYGLLLILIGIVMIVINPIEIITNRFLAMEEGSFLYNMWESPPYDVSTEVWAFNYTNVEEFLSGEDTVLKLQEIGPFVYREMRTNRNMSVDPDRGVMTLTPDIEMRFDLETSIADTKDVNLYMPNIAVIAMSTLFADKLNYFLNAGAYFSLKTLGSQLFRKMTADEIFWGYQDNIVTIVNKLLPGWIDFDRLGILDRMYALANKHENVEVELGDVSRKFSINEWDGSEGIRERDFEYLNTSTPCNRIKGAYEGIMFPPDIDTEKIMPIYRKQACGILPFQFNRQTKEKYGFNYYRFELDKASFDNSSEYACECDYNCLPNGFVDIGNCYYGFPIVLSKVHFLDADPSQIKHFEGLHPNPELHNSFMEMEPTIGIPLSLKMNFQVNMAVRMSNGNPITRPVENKILPILWLSITCNSPPPYILTLLNLRLRIGPPLIITIEIVLLILGAVLGIHSFYRIYKPRYKLVEPKNEIRDIDHKNSIIYRSDNIIYKDETFGNQGIKFLSNELPD